MNSIRRKQSTELIESKQSIQRPKNLVSTEHIELCMLSNVSKTKSSAQITSFNR